ncbi:hypothetical protein Tco_1082144 [Tanacetum coccineum]|uniref:Reverse transcriptase zinc-binding domain-containing protein n=1 Tax=Tanacetum coccineum TaxID=301880 RepID=A0ABQ4YN11_9ASTR
MEESVRCLGCHIKYEIGNGRDTYMWYDNWSGLGPISNIISYRSLYKARLDKEGKVTHMFHNGQWIWTIQWNEEFLALNNIDVPSLNHGKTNKIFYVRNVYDSMRDSNEEVICSPLVWYTQCIPKHFFILWMDIQFKLLSHEKLKNLVRMLDAPYGSMQDHLPISIEVVVNQIRRGGGDALVMVVAKCKDGCVAFVLVFMVNRWCYNIHEVVCRRQTGCGGLLAVEGEDVVGVVETQSRSGGG